MEDFLGIIIWIVFIGGGIIKYITKLSSEGEGNNKRKDIEKKIGDFFSGKTDQGEQRPDEYSRDKAQKQSFDDEWVPVYEETPVNNDRPLNKVSGQSPGLSLEKAGLDQKLKQKRNNITQTQIDDEINIRNGNIVNTKTNRPTASERKKMNGNDAYRKTNKRVKTYLDEDSFNSDDLIKGVIFKEILDQPRAKRPYRPFERIR